MQLKKSCFKGERTNFSTIREESGLGDCGSGLSSSLVFDAFC